MTLSVVMGKIMHLTKLFCALCADTFQGQDVVCGSAHKVRTRCV